jgi:7-carboxy-7-deazaguanine synthase
MNNLSNLSLNLIEIFPSVQGETSLAGLPTTFIRLAQCNLRCSWCDTAYSFGRGNKWSLDQIIQKTEEFGCSTVCITGGEPLLQANVHALMTELCDRRYNLSIETGGSLPIQPIDYRVKVILDIKCPGSGMEKKNDWNNLNHLEKKDEVKFVLADRLDYDYAKEIIHQQKLDQIVDHLLFSPVFGKLDPQTLVSWILADRLPVRLNLQIHKFIWDPLQKGV